MYDLLTKHVKEENGIEFHSFKSINHDIRVQLSLEQVSGKVPFSADKLWKLNMQRLLEAYGLWPDPSEALARDAMAWVRRQQNHTVDDQGRLRKLSPNGALLLQKLSPDGARLFQWVQRFKSKKLNVTEQGPWDDLTVGFASQYSPEEIEELASQWGISYGPSQSDSRTSSSIDFSIQNQVDNAMSLSERFNTMGQVLARCKSSLCEIHIAQGHNAEVDFLFVGRDHRMLPVARAVGFETIHYVGDEWFEELRHMSKHFFRFAPQDFFTRQIWGDVQDSVISIDSIKNWRPKSLHTRPPRH